MRMQQAKQDDGARPGDGQQPAPRNVVASGRIESKLGLAPSEHRSSKPFGDDLPPPAKRARLRRHGSGVRK